MTETFVTREDEDDDDDDQQGRGMAHPKKLPLSLIRDSILQFLLILILCPPPKRKRNTAIQRTKNPMVINSQHQSLSTASSFLLFESAVCLLCLCPALSFAIGSSVVVASAECRLLQIIRG